VVDALLTVRNVNGPDGTIILVIPINFFFVAVRHGDRWLIQDGARAFRGRAAFEHDQVLGVSKLASRMTVPCSMQLDKERNATSTPECKAGVRVVRRHHLLVRCSHWLNVPILLGLRSSAAIVSLACT